MHRCRIWEWALVMRWYCPANLPSCWTDRCRPWSSGSTLTLNGLVEDQTTPESEVQADTADSAGRSWIDEPIAVIGMGCRFPSDVHGPEAFWQFLVRAGRR